MDERRFDSLSRSLAAAKTRRDLLVGLAALGAGLIGARTADAQAQCGNKTCRNNPGKCSSGCVCCEYGNGNTRCVPAGGCTGTVACPTGSTPCNGRCITLDSLQTDPANCGSCGITCPAVQTCVGGTCSCPAGAEFCNGACLDPIIFQSDENNCGGCGNSCPGDACAIPSCLDGSCGTEPVTCDDFDPCTDNICDPDQGGCTYPFNTAPCTTGGAAGTCSLGACIPNPTTTTTTATTTTQAPTELELNGGTFQICTTSPVSCFERTGCLTCATEVDGTSHWLCGEITSNPCSVTADCAPGSVCLPPAGMCFAAC